MNVFDFTKASGPLSSEQSGLREEVISHFHTYWGEVETSWGEVEGSRFLSERIERGARLVTQALRESEKLLQLAGHSTENIQAVLMVGAGGANGHAFLRRGSPIAWFAVESYTSVLQAKVFVMHELVHALHYGLSPEYAFRCSEEKNLVWRQLITEGIATSLTKRLWSIRDEEALWADTLPTEQCRRWMLECQHSKQELFEFALRNFYSCDPRLALFYAQDSDDIFSFRAGYYVALKLVEDAAFRHHLSDRDLLRIKTGPMKAWIEEALRRPKQRVGAATIPG